jgi:hypothetical protein
VRPGGVRPPGVTLLVVALVASGVSAGGGVALVAAPDGGLLGLSPAALAGSPFGSYLVPGLALLVVPASGPWSSRVASSVAAPGRGPAPSPSASLPSDRRHGDAGTTLRRFGLR